VRKAQLTFASPHGADGSAGSARTRPPSRPAGVDGRAIEDLDIGEAVWISKVISDAQPLHVRASTVLEAGDEVLVLVDPEESRDPGPVFTAPLNG
jgi:hypothetical protein